MHRHKVILSCTNPPAQAEDSLQQYFFMHIKHATELTDIVPDRGAEHF